MPAADSVIESSNGMILAVLAGIGGLVLPVSSEPHEAQARKKEQAAIRRKVERRWGMIPERWMCN